MNVRILCISTILVAVAGCAHLGQKRQESPMEEAFAVYQIGTIQKEEERTYIVLKEQYEPGLMRLEQFSHVTVLYWFHLNDTPEKRAVLQVHPQGNKANPMRGVFATHSPARPNLIAISRCKILSVKDNVIEIDSIDAFDDTPVIDLKN